MIRALALSICLTLAASPMLAADRSELNSFVSGNVEFVLLHELAHYIIGEYDVPILGPLESTADYTAIVMAIRGDGSAEAKTFLTQAMRDAATSFATSWRLAEANEVEMPYWDVHALSIQRYYAALCLIYGSDTESNSRLLAKLPKARAAGCKAEYELADRGFQWLLDTYSASEVETRSGMLEFTYEQVASRQQKQLTEMLQESNLIENTVNAVTALFPPREPMSIVMRVCKRPEAAWQPARRELTICYELLDAFAAIRRTSKRVGSR